MLAVRLLAAVVAMLVVPLVALLVGLLFVQLALRLLFVQLAESSALAVPLVLPFLLMQSRSREQNPSSPTTQR